MPALRIVVNICGGCVQDVFCTEPDVDLVIVDWDSEGCDPGAPNLVEILDDNGRPEFAFVVRAKAGSWNELAGTMVAHALQAAGLAPDQP